MKEPSMLEVSRLSLRRGAKSLIFDLSFRLAHGEFLAILGPNGAGKSSLIQGILGLLPIASGEIRIGGRILDELSAEQRATSMAYVPQQSALNVDWTAEEVVRMGRFAHRRASSRAAQLDQQVVERSMLETDVSRVARRSFLSLSGGERSRVLIARALATEAPLLLLDEPTQCLDPAHAMDCLNHLGTLRNMGKTVVIVTHDLNQVTLLADEILLLRAGQKYAMGPTKQLLKSRNVEEVFGVRLVPDAAFGYARLGQMVEGNDA